jgi:hypothetical protein
MLYIEETDAASNKEMSVVGIKIDMYENIRESYGNVSGDR